MEEITVQMIGYSVPIDVDERALLNGQQATAQCPQRSARLSTVMLLTFQYVNIQTNI